MASEESSGSAHDSPGAPATRGQVQQLQVQLQQQQVQLQQQQVQLEQQGQLQQQLQAAIGASEARLLHAIQQVQEQLQGQLQQLQPCRCPSDMNQRLEAVEERLQHMHVADAQRASAHGSVNQAR